MQNITNSEFNLILQKIAKNWINNLNSNNSDIIGNVSIINTINETNTIVQGSDMVKILIDNKFSNMNLKIYLFLVFNEDDYCYNVASMFRCTINDIVVNKKRKGIELHYNEIISDEKFLQEIIEALYRDCKINKDNNA